MGSVVVHPKAEEDIMTLGCVDPSDMGFILALFGQLRADPKKFANLMIHGYGEFKKDDFNVKEWATAQDSGRDLWRLKHLGLERDGKFYRIPFCMSHDRKTAHMLAVVRVYDANAEFDYDDTQSPIVRRIFDAYDAVRARA